MKINSPAGYWLLSVVFICISVSGCNKSSTTLIQEINNENPSVRAQAIKELGKRKERDAVKLLIRVLESDPSSNVRESAAEALGQIGDPIGVESLTNSMHDADISVRRASIVALGEIGDPRATMKLIPSLEDELFHIRIDTIRALGKLENPIPVPYLITAMNDRDEFIRFCAAEALGKIMDPRSVDPLIEKLNGPDQDLRWEAHSILCQLTG